MAKREAGRRIDSKVKALRAARGWSLTTLAGIARVTIPSVQRAERGDVLAVRLEVLLRIANALGVTVAEVWPLLGPMLPGLARSREALIRAQIEGLDAERAKRAEPEWRADRGVASDRA